MALTPSIRVGQIDQFTVLSVLTPEIRTSQYDVFTVFNFPTEIERVSQFNTLAVTTGATPMRTSQIDVMTLVIGRPENTRVRAWTFTLDGHDFYVLRLGDRGTLVYDTSTEQWVEWTSEEFPFWRPNTGFTWVGGKAIAQNLGSSIVAGDDVFGLLWLLDPRQPYDSAPDPARNRQRIPFERIVSGQVLAKGRDYTPCYAIFLDGDNYGMTSDFVPTVTLETSDDQGRTFTSHGALTVPADPDQSEAYEWLSLGQFTSPGRIFRVTDNGVFTRLDSMEMNDAG